MPPVLSIGAWSAVLLFVSLITAGLFETSGGHCCLGSLPFSTIAATRADSR